MTTELESVIEAAPIKVRETLRGKLALGISVDPAISQAVREVAERLAGGEPSQEFRTYRGPDCDGVVVNHRIYDENSTLARAAFEIRKNAILCAWGMKPGEFSESDEKTAREAYLEVAKRAGRITSYAAQDAIRAEAEAFVQAQKTEGEKLA